MELPLSNHRRMSVDEFDTRIVLSHAAKQARERGYQNFPIIDVDSIDAVIAVLQETGVDMATLATPIETDDERQSRDVVKVVTALSGDALYFSRAPLAGAQRHVGMYGYQTGVLRALASLAPSPLELAESLEQLRALQNGFKIRVIQTTRPHLGVDRPEDVARVEHELAKQ